MEWFRKEISEINDDNNIVAAKQEQLLALRGMLAHGLLEHCLCRRWRVDYGVDPRRGLRQRVAVPYRASDTPSERSEYSQPDVLIIFTILSYFRSGLSCAEIREAVTALLRLGDLAQKAEYQLWFQSASTNMSPKEKGALDKVGKLDLSSDVQVAMLQRVYQFNMATICFWLNTCVLPRETMQFPRSLICNAFNLTHSDHPAKAQKRTMIGFSGTKDNYLLLPCPVKFDIPKHPELMATDGLMMDLVFCKQTDHIYHFASDSKRQLSVLEYAVRNARALIDAGATMAGLCNNSVAKTLLTLITKHAKPFEGYAPICMHEYERLHPNSSHWLLRRIKYIHKFTQMHRGGVFFHRRKLLASPQ